ncbi:MAG: type I methionyl aminopeptidase [Candidatus Taylorbacteria bacterium]|nr:type I methionyl aminopeptidase [Candidatus Taylorbacteria bacterium]
MIKLKTKDDIKILREGGKRHAEIMRLLVAKVAPGVTTQELDEYAEKLINEGGDKAAFLNYKPRGAKHAYPATICASINEEVVHGIPDNKHVLKEGDIISLDIGLIHKGLITDMAVTVPVGAIDEASRKLLDITEKSLYVGIKAAKGGDRTGDIGNAIERFVIPFGYGIVRNLSGHGVGYEIHEDPFVPNFGEAHKGDILSPGLVIAIEPMINIGTQDVVLAKDGYTFITADGSRSAHFEHTIVITKSGAEILTQ